MKPHLIPCGLALILATVLIGSGPQLVQATTITIDFTGIPDGTPLSANNPYGGVVDLQAQGGYRYHFPLEWSPEGYPIGNGGEAWAEAGYILGGVVWVYTPSGTIVPTGGEATRGMTSLTATFLQPINELSFTTHVPDHWVDYNYKGLDGNGDPFSGSGMAPTDGLSPDPWFTTVLKAPAGGHFTELDLGNWDPAFGVAPDIIGVGGAPFALKSMELGVLDQVPEPRAFAEIVFLVLLVAAAPLPGRKLRTYP
jgi:hypothetical protein